MENPISEGILIIIIYLIIIGIIIKTLYWLFVYYLPKRNREINLKKKVEILQTIEGKIIQKALIECNSEPIDNILKGEYPLKKIHIFFRDEIFDGLNTALDNKRIDDISSMRKLLYLYPINDIDKESFGELSQTRNFEQNLKKYALEIKNNGSLEDMIKLADKLSLSDDFMFKDLSKEQTDKIIKNIENGNYDVGLHKPMFDSSWTDMPECICDTGEIRSAVLSRVDFLLENNKDIEDISRIFRLKKGKYNNSWNIGGELLSGLGHLIIYILMLIFLIWIAIIFPPLWIIYIILIIIKIII
jgi:hypothetical protein